MATHRATTSRCLTRRGRGRRIQGGPRPGTEFKLTISRFDALRWRMGRRSRAQLAALDWSGDPTPVIDHLVVFGPAVHDIDE
jgi:hypothetical protein